jgi:hypothetical protein
MCFVIATSIVMVNFDIKGSKFHHGLYQTILLVKNCNGMITILIIVNNRYEKFLSLVRLPRGSYLGNHN